MKLIISREGLNTHFTVFCFSCKNQEFYMVIGNVGNSGDIKSKTKTTPVFFMCFYF